jgi:hypothetical protein
MALIIDTGNFIFSGKMPSRLILQSKKGILTQKILKSLMTG